MTLQRLPVSQAMLAEKGSRMEKPHWKTKKDIQGNIPQLDLTLWPAQEMKQTQLMNFSLATCHPNLHLTMKGITSPGIHAQITCIPPPPDDRSEEPSAPYHDSARDQMTSEAEESQETHQVNNMEVPTHVNADKDDFQNTIRQKLGKELSEALWREDTNGQPLT